MTVATSQRRVQYLLDGTSTVFPVPFPFLGAADLQVVRTSDTGLETALALNADYAVAGVGDPGGGNVTLPAPGTSGDRLTIKRVVERTQLTDYVPNDPFPAEAHERALDRLTMAVQEDGDELSRALVLPDTDPRRGQMVLPPLPGRAGKFLAFDADGRPVGATGGGVDSALRTDLAAAGGGQLVSFSPSGVGAVVRSLQAKLEDFGISVKDHGAVGDRVADETLAFQRAILAAYVNGKALVIVPPALGYKVLGTIQMMPGVSVIGQVFTREWNAAVFNEVSQAQIFKPATGASPGPIFEMATRTVLRGLDIAYQRIGGAETGIIRMGPNTLDGWCFNAQVIDCSIEGRAFDGGAIYYNAQCHGIFSPESRLSAVPGQTRQRYFNQVVNCYGVNLDHGVTLNGQSNGWSIINFRTFQVYRPIVIDGGASEVADTLVAGLHAQNFGPLAGADTYVLTMRGSVNVLTVSGVSECQGRAYDVSGLTSYSQWNLNSFIPNESLPSYLPPNAEQQGFSTGTMREGLRRTFITDPARNLDRHVQLRGMKYDGPLPVTGSLPTLAGGTAPQALVQANASSRIIAAFQTGPYSVGSHPLMRCTLKVIVDGPTTSGASYAEVEFLYRRTTSTGGGAGSLTVLRTFNDGPGIAGLHFIHSKTGGGFFKIGMVGGGVGGPAPDYITVELTCSIYAADGSTWARDGFTNIVTAAVAATANDVADAVSLLATGTTAI
jgi:hypothetical protein